MIDRRPAHESPIRVAVVDTGLEPGNAALAPIVGGVAMRLDDSGEVLTTPDYVDLVGHGTACGGIISRGMRSHIELLAVRVVDGVGPRADPAPSAGTRRRPERLLEEAIRWSVSNGARVINMSLGVSLSNPESRARLSAVLRTAMERNVITVAAAGPHGSTPLPAVLEEVVTIGSAMCPQDVLYADDGGFVDFLANGDLQRVAWLGNGSALAQGASLAAAHVTRTICGLLRVDPTLGSDGVKRALAARAVQGDAGFRGRWRSALDRFYRARTPESASWIRRAAVYPFNKEIHALIRYRELLSFELHAVADPPAKRMVGRDAGELLGMYPAGLLVQPSLDRALEGADTLILGHTEAQAALRGKPYLWSIFERAITTGKHVYSLSPLKGVVDPVVLERAKEDGLRVVDPTVGREEVEGLFAALDSNPAARRPSGDDAGFRRNGGILLRNAAHALRHDCPVLGVFGTSRAQGKFSLQLELRVELAKRRYRVAHLATEPTGMLMGATATVPMGYARGYNFRAEVWAHLSRLLMVEMKNRERPDIIIVGGQSGIAAFNHQLLSLGFDFLDAMAFGMATQPDACILVCNLFDAIAHIQRCIDVIRSVVHSRVIALAVNDRIFQQHEWRGVVRKRAVRLQGTELEEKLRNIAQALNLPCYGVLAPGGVEHLADAAIDFFSDTSKSPEIKHLT